MPKQHAKFIICTRIALHCQRNSSVKECRSQHAPPRCGRRRGPETPPQCRCSSKPGSRCSRVSTAASRGTAAAAHLGCGVRAQLQDLALRGDEHGQRVQRQRRRRHDKGWNKHDTALRHSPRQRKDASAHHGLDDVCHRLVFRQAAGQLRRGRLPRHAMRSVRRCFGCSGPSQPNGLTSAAAAAAYTHSARDRPRCGCATAVMTARGRHAALRDASAAVWAAGLGPRAATRRWLGTAPHRTAGWQLSCVASMAAV